MGDPRKTARSFAAELESLFGDRLRSALLYGSVARGEAIPSVSDINLLVLLDDVALADLAAASGLARAWVERGNTAPLLLGAEEWRRGADVFAVELSDMKDHHEVLSGDDPLEGLSVDPRALRLQTERELRGKLLQLQEGLLVSSGHAREVATLLLAALPSFTTYLRALLRLQGRAVPATTAEAVREACALASADPDGLLDAWRARAGRRPPEWSLEAPPVPAYWEAVRRITTYVDTLASEERR